MGAPLATTPPEQPLDLVEKLRLSGEVLSTYARVRWVMWRNELPAAVALLRAPGSDGGAPATMPRFNKWRLSNAIIRVLRLLPTDSRCLMRSLVMLSMLERRGVSPTLVIGVKTDPEFAAHAWIEEGGETLLPAGEDGEFRRLTEL